MMRPAAHEFAPYYEKYIDLVKGDVLEELRRQATDIPQFLQSIPKEKEYAAYAPGKWPLKEVIGHITDTERIMAYRALRIARRDLAPLPGFDQDDYVRHSSCHSRSMSSLSDEFGAVRRSNLLLFESFDEAALGCRGVASGNPVSVRALLYIVAGHALHHITVIKERYL